MVVSGTTIPAPRSNREKGAIVPGHPGLFVFMVLILVWAPIPIGSNRTWSLALLEIGFLTLLGVLALRYSHGQFGAPDSLRYSRLPLVLLSIWLLYPLLQLIPLPANLMETLGGRSHSPYIALLADSKSGSAFLSLDRSATFSEFLWQCSLVALLICVLSLTTTSLRVRVLLTVMFMTGFFEAIYGLLNYFGGDGLRLWNPGHTSGSVSGTYVNQNHFAGLMEMTIPVGLGLLLCYQEEQRSQSRPGNVFISLISQIGGQGGIILFCIAVMMAALILTTSRGGTGALAVGISSAVLLAAVKRRGGAKEVKLGVVAVVLAVIALFWIGPGQFPEKIQSTGLMSQRGELREISYDMIAESPLFGTGAGTYRWVFPGYKDERFGGNFYEHAHNDFLQVLGEQGFVGVTLLVSGTVVIFLRIVSAFYRRRDPLMRGTLFAAIAGCVSLLVHGLVDFNLQIPANAVYFVVLLGLGLVACQLKSSSRTG